MSPWHMLPGQMSLWRLASVKDGPRNIPLKFGQNRVSNSWDTDWICTFNISFSKNHLLHFKINGTIVSWTIVATPWIIKGYRMTFLHSKTRVAKRLFQLKNVRIMYLLNITIVWRMKMNEFLFSSLFHSFGVKLCHESTLL